jgi:hypothetical protein
MSMAATTALPNKDIEEPHMKLRTQLALAAFAAGLAFSPVAFADDMGMAPSSGSAMAPASGDAMSAPATDKDKMDKKDEMKKGDTMAPETTSSDAMAPASGDAMSAPNNAMKH